MAIPAIVLKNKDLSILKTCLVCSLKRRFDFVYKDEIFLIATFLDYRYKNFEFFGKPQSETHLKTTITALISLFKQRFLKDVQATVQLSETVEFTTQSIPPANNNPRKKHKGLLLQSQDKIFSINKCLISEESKVYQNFV